MIPVNNCIKEVLNAFGRRVRITEMIGDFNNSNERQLFFKTSYQI